MYQSYKDQIDFWLLSKFKKKRDQNIDNLNLKIVIIKTTSVNIIDFDYFLNRDTIHDLISEATYIIH